MNGAKSAIAGRRAERMLILRRHAAALVGATMAHAALFAAMAVGAPRPPIEPVAIPVAMFEGVGILIPTRTQQAEPVVPPATIPEPVEPAEPDKPAQSPVVDDPRSEAAPAESVLELVTRLVRAGPSELTAPLEVGGAPVAAAAPAPPTPPPNSGETCEIAGSLQVSLQTDPLALAAVAKVPRTARSIANAILLWDGQWADPSLLGGDQTAEAIRSVIRQAVERQSPTCRDQLVRGPRFVPLIDGADTTVLTIGSGVWRWSDLVGEATTRP